MLIREYVWLDGRPLAMVEGGQTYRLHWGQIGRPVMATDSTGTAVWAASYLRAAADSSSLTGAYSTGSRRLSFR